MSPQLRLAPLTSEDEIRCVAAMEAASYPADEAATESGIRFRQKNAGAFFSVAYLPPNDQNGGKLVGFVNGTLTAHDELTDESMSQHDPHGSLLCIHSVVIDKNFRRQGLAAQMLKKYVQGVIDSQSQVKRIMLIAKAYLVSFYVSCGFSVTRLSPVVHGQDPWFELQLDCEEARLPPVVQVDAFTSEPFQGNPAAVVMLSPTVYYKQGASEWMQRVALENNLSETAFVAPRAATSSTPENILEYDLRWFTPAAEVKLCGHATLSTAFALHDAGHVTTSHTLHFYTLSGVLICQFEEHPQTRKLLVLMDFPVQPIEPMGSDVIMEEVAAALSIPSNSIIDVKKATTDLLIRVTPQAFSAMQPDIGLLKKVDVRGVTVTSEMPNGNTSDVDIQSRFFAPRVGIDEDPVTGSAHCALGPYWQPLLKKTTIRAQQFTPVRGGYITLDLESAGPGRVLLKGEGVIVLRGKLTSLP